eukprot:3475035-Prymnesium_polylepis.1
MGCPSPCATRMTQEGMAIRGGRQCSGAALGHSVLVTFSWDTRCSCGRLGRTCSTPYFPQAAHSRGRGAAVEHRGIAQPACGAARAAAHRALARVAHPCCPAVEA